MKKNLWLFFLLVFTSCLPRQEILRPGPSNPHPTTTQNGSGRDDRSQDRTSGGNSNTGTSASNNASTLTGRPGVIPAGIDYIERYRAIALEEMDKHGIPASIKLEQALLESGYGNSRLAREANNHFGIKCAGDWDGGRTYHDDDEENDCFRVYSSPEQSFRDHSSFLLRRRYEKLFTLDRHDYKAWAHGLKEAGYATNPRYAALLIDLIERYELHQLDRPLQPGSFRQTANRLPAPTPQQEAAPVRQTEPTKQDATPKQMKIHEVAQGESISSIARQYGLSVEQLIALNSLKTQDLHPGQLLVVSK